MDDRSRSETYRIRVRGALDPRWADWFNGLSMQVETTETGYPVTILEGKIQSQSALRGIINKLFDTNLPLLEVEAYDRAEQGRPED